MLNKKSPNTLKLHSYKIDTEQLQNSLRSLNEMKQQMQTTISHYKSQEDHLTLENQRLKQEIQILQNKSETKVDISGYQSKILRLEAELKEQKRETERFKRLQENQKRSKQILSKQYENKLQQHMTESKLMVDNYQQRIASLSVSLKQAKIQLQLTKSQIMAKKQTGVGSGKAVSSSWGIRDDELNMRTDSEGDLPMNNTDGYMMEESGRSNPRSAAEITKKTSRSSQMALPPKSPAPPTINSNNNATIRDYKTTGEIAINTNKKIQPHFSFSATYVPNQEDQQIFSGSIRKLYQEIKDMGLSSAQMAVLPQFKKMASIKSPSHKDIYNFLKKYHKYHIHSPPIQQQNESTVQKNTNFLQTLIRQKYGKLQGNHITELIIARVEDYENSSKLNTEDMEISGMTPSVSKTSSGYGYERSQRYSEGNYRERERERDRGGYERYINGSRPSIQDNLRVQSEASMF